MLIENKTIGRNRKAMKVECKFYRTHKALEILPRIGVLWGGVCLLSVCSVEIEWLKWCIVFDFYGDNACR